MYWTSLAHFDAEYDDIVLFYYLSERDFYYIKKNQITQKLKSLQETVIRDGFSIDRSIVYVCQCSVNSISEKNKTHNFKNPARSLSLSTLNLKNVFL